MKILYLALVEMDIHGGPRTHLLEICQNLAALGNDILILLPAQKVKPRVGGCRVVTIPFFGFSIVRLAIYYLTMGFYLIYYLVRFRPDSIYEREMNNLLPVIICRIFRKPIIMEVNGSIRDDMEQIKASRLTIGIACLVQRYELKCADRIIVTGVGLKNMLQKEYRLMSDKVFVVDNGVNTELFHPMDRSECRERIMLNTEKFYLGFAGTFHPHHDITTLISALPVVLQSNPDVYLVLIGKGMTLDDAKRRASEMGIDNRVIFRGSVPHDEMPYYINSFNISILTANKIKLNREGISSFKLMEYMACGQAIIVNDVPDSPTPQALRDRVISVPPGDPKLLGEAIVSLMKDRDLREKLGERALNFIEEGYTWKDAAEKTQRLLLHKKAGA